MNCRRIYLDRYVETFHRYDSTDDDCVRRNSSEAPVESDTDQLYLHIDSDLHSIHHVRYHRVNALILLLSTVHMICRTVQLRVHVAYVYYINFAISYCCWAYYFNLSLNLII